MVYRNISFLSSLVSTLIFKEGELTRVMIVLQIEDNKQGFQQLGEAQQLKSTPSTNRLSHEISTNKYLIWIVVCSVEFSSSSGPSPVQRGLNGAVEPSSDSTGCRGPKQKSYQGKFERAYRENRALWFVSLLFTAKSGCKWLPTRGSSLDTLTRDEGREPGNLSRSH